MSEQRNAGPSNAESCIGIWIDLYVSGRWTLAEFEAHLEAHLPKFTPEDWLPRRKRSGKPRTAKQAARSWQAAAASYETNYVSLISASAWYREADPLGFITNRYMDKAATPLV